MQLKDVIHFYPGCKLKTETGSLIFLGTIAEVPPCTTFQIGVLNGNYSHSTSLEGIKPILRRTSSITDDEKKEIFEIIFKRKFPDSGRIIWFGEKTRTTDQRWCLWSGVDRAIIEIDGTVWADCDLNHYKFNSHLITAYLLSKGFDLWNLIDSNQAIEKKHSNP